MRPHIQVARSAGGGIPCFEIGSGDALIVLPAPPFSHLEFELNLPRFRAWYELLARSHRLIRYDQRGTGVARHLIPATSLEEQAADLEAVAAHFGLKRFILLAQFNTTPMALKFAAEHPDLVSHLILAHPTTREDFASPRMRAVKGLLTEDWDMFVETVARARTGWNAGEHAVQMAELIRASAGRENVQRQFELLEVFDAWPYVTRISMPALVLYSPPADDTGPSGSRTKFLDAPLELTSRIPSAVLSFIPGDAAAPYLGDSEAVVEIIRSFLERPVGEARSVPLSEREREVLLLLAAGASNGDIAEALVVSLSTVKTHVQSIYAKLDVHSRTQALAAARGLGLIS